MSKVITFKDVFAHCVDEDHIDKWDKIALSTEKVDKVKSEELINKIYEDANLEAPKIIWYGSPQAAALKIASILDKDKFKSTFKFDKSSEYYSIFNPVKDEILVDSQNVKSKQILDVVPEDLVKCVPMILRGGKTFFDDVLEEIGIYLRRHDSSMNYDDKERVWDSTNFLDLRGSVWHSRDLDDYNETMKGAIFELFSYGEIFDEHDFYKLMFFDFYRSRLGLIKETEFIADFIELSQICGRIYAFEGLCIATERPSSLLYNEYGLHCSNGPAVTYNDGWCVYAINGDSVPKFE